MKRRILAIVLALSMMVPFFSVTGFATETDESLAHYAEGKGYLAIGDSVTRGYALPTWDEEGYTIDNLDDPNCRNVTGSYPKIIADTLGCYAPDDMTDKKATYWPVAQDALTTSFILDLLGVSDLYYDKEYLHDYNSMLNRYKTDLYYFGDKYSFSTNGITRYGRTGKAYSIRELVSDASLISIEIGMSDILNRARSLAADPFLDAGGDLSDTKAVVKVLGNFVIRMYEGYKRWEKSFPMILDYFADHKKSDATVVIIGAFNPMYGITATEEISVPIGNVMSSLTNSMNEKYRQWAKEYGFIFVDISNVDTGASVNQTNIMDFLSAKTRDQGIATHPTEEGYQQIARMVLNALRENDAEQKTETTTLKADLGILSDGRVNYVAVDGKKLSANAYEIKDHVLTIPLGSADAKRLTVSSIGKNGRISLSMYALDFDEADGYIPTRFYSTTDAISATIRAVFNTLDAVKSVLSR